jgi:hypothetical protein
MKFIAQDIYEETKYGWDDYDPMIKAFGNPVLIETDENYQGDTRVLYRDGERFGYLCFGWGSCSGCDALQACADYDDLQILIDEIYASIRWFDNADEAANFFDTHDWAGDYGHSPTFNSNAKEILEQYRHE